MTTVWGLKLPTNRKMVLLKLADHCDHEGRNAFPSVGRISRESGLGERTVQVILKEFVDQGALEVTDNEQGGRGKMRVFRICIDRLVPLYGIVEHPKKGAPAAPIQSAEPAEKGAADAPLDEERVQGEDGMGADDDDKGCNSSAPEPSHNLQKPSHAHTPAPAREAAALPHASGGGLASQAPPPPDAKPGEKRVAARVWNDNLERIELMFGENDFDNYLIIATPHLDDGETLTLALPSRFLAGMVEQKFGPLIGEMIGRKIVCEAHSFAAAAAIKRKADWLKTRQARKIIGGAP